MRMNQIEHKVALPDGSFANTVGPRDIVEAMYPAGMTDQNDLYVADTRRDGTGVELTAMNSVLRFEDIPDGRRAILGNTVTRGCPVALDCGNCALTGAGLSTTEMSAKNCARANTARAFELAGQEPRGRFMLLPTGKNSFVVDHEHLTAEYNGSELLQQKLQAAPSVVITESWLREQHLEQFTVGMNGADGSMGVANTEIDGERLFIPFCSMRQNMGDRGPEDQILRQALTAYFESKGLDEAKRQEVLRTLDVSITLAASASLPNFGHKIQIPREGDDATEGEKAYAAELRRKYPDLIARAGGKVTSAIVLNDQYPGAMARGNIYPELEAKLGIHETPITPDNCPGDGQTCNIHYRSETEYALTEQLKQLGVPEGNIHFDDRDVLDPASPDNKAASNRVEQNNGVKVANTNRTLNAMIVRLLA
jgi:hypothetical protein